MGYFSGRLVRAPLVVMCFVVLVGCGGSDSVPDPTKAADLRISGAWVASLDLETVADPKSAMSAAYAEIENLSSKENALVGLRSSAIDSIEMHETVTSGSSGKMTKVDEVNLPADSLTKLEPGGFHLMLIGPYKNLVKGTKIDLEFTFRNGTVVQRMIPVIDRADRPGTKHGSSTHDTK